jgi:hypothetical protein
MLKFDVKLAQGRNPPRGGCTALLLHDCPCDAYRCATNDHGGQLLACFL